MMPKDSGHRLGRYYGQIYAIRASMRWEELRAVRLATRSDAKNVIESKHAHEVR